MGVSKAAIVALALSAVFAVQATEYSVRFSAEESTDSQYVLYASMDAVEMDVIPTIRARNGFPQRVTRFSLGDSDDAVINDVPEEPALPVIRRALAFAEGKDLTVDVEVLSVANVAIEAPVEPSRGHIMRGTDLRMVPHIFASNVYMDESYSSQPTARFLGSPFTLRDFSGLTLEINPWSYTPSQNSLNYAASMRIVISATDGSVIKPAAKSVVRDFVPIYEATFLNFSEESHLTDSDADSILLVIYGDDLLDAATAIKNWKGEATTVDLKSCTEMGGTSDAILTSIENYYNTNPGLTYVVIVGDINAVPSPTGPHSNAVSDPLYALMGKSPEDYAFDIMVSRISAVDVDGAMFQVDKFTKYDADTSSSDYDTDAIGIGSPYDGGTGLFDWQRILSYFRLLKQGLGFDTFNLNCDTDAEVAGPEPVVKQASRGRSVLLYTGHGSGTSWDTSKFSTDNSKELTNKYENAFIVDVSCDNGNFALDECLAESWLRGSSSVPGSGALSMFSSAPTAAWVPPAVMQKSVVQGLVAHPESTVGSAYISGMMKAFSQYPNSDGYYLVESYIIFGDASMPHGHIGSASSASSEPFTMNDLAKERKCKMVG